MWLRVFLVGAVLAWCAAAACAAPVAKLAASTPPDPSAPLPISAFYADPNISGAQISPAGKSLAMIQHVKGAVAVVVQSLGGGGAKAIFGADDKYTFLDWLRWKGENRLLVGITYIRI